jgi:hypothetical protein
MPGFAANEQAFFVLHGRYPKAYLSDHETIEIEKVFRKGKW